MRGFVLDQYEPNPSKFVRFRDFVSFFFSNVQKNMVQNCNSFQFAPNAPGPLGPFPRARSRSCGSWGLTAPYEQMAPQLCLYEISNFDVFSTIPKNTFWHSGNHLAEDRKSFFSFISLLFFEDSTLSKFPFLRRVI